MSTMSSKDIPLAVEMRPKTLDDFVGQEHVLGKGKILWRIFVSKRVPPLIFYGPPGCGKTTLGFVLAEHLKAELEYINAAFSSVKEVKTILEKARKREKETKKKTVLFIDEIHRFTKTQQEALVPDTENQTVAFVGTTIYNPSYYLIPSLISRSVTVRFLPLKQENIVTIINQTIKKNKKRDGFKDIDIKKEAVEYISEICDGDARRALNALEVAVLSTKEEQKKQVDLEVVKESIQRKGLFDKKGQYHYDTISAFIKSVRGSDVDSALYWLAKMISSGEDPRFIARRLVILAAEDISNAQPFALVMATSCFNAVEAIGEPESNLILAQVTCYLAACPKSNASCTAINKALQDVDTEDDIQVPEHIKTHSKQYKYPHSYYVSSKIGGFVNQFYGAKNKYYFPQDIGNEAEIKNFLETIEKLKNK